MIHESQLKAIHEAMRVVSSDGTDDIDETKHVSTFVAGMKDWLADLESILKKSANVAPSQRKMFTIHYARWVKSYGSFYRTVLRNNPGLAAVFSTIEDSLKIEVKVMGEGLDESIKIFDRGIVTEAEDADADFSQTLIELLDKTPSTSLKAKFTYQFNRWAKTNPRELSIAEIQTPTLYAFIQEIVSALDADEEVNDSDVEHLHKQKALDKVADSAAAKQADQPVDQSAQQPTP